MAVNDPRTDTHPAHVPPLAAAAAAIPDAVPEDEPPPSYDQAVQSSLAHPVAAPPSQAQNQTQAHTPASAPTAAPSPSRSSSSQRPTSAASSHHSGEPPGLPQRRPTSTRPTQSTPSLSNKSRTASGKSFPRQTPAPGEDPRPLPPGWIRQVDSNTNHVFYVDQRANGGRGRSTWVHPYYDPKYLATLDPKTRARAEWDNSLNRLRSLGVDVSVASPPPMVSGKRREHQVDVQARMSRAFSLSRQTGRAVFLQRDTDAKEVVVLPPRLAPPGAPEPFMHLISDPRLKCIRTPDGNGPPVEVRRNKNGAVVGGVIGGVLLGALLL